jgi:hypothetical protein
MTPLDAFDFDTFWEKSEYADRKYVDQLLSAAALADVESELGFKLPAAYVELATHQNGGTPFRTLHGVSTPTSWARDHVALTGIYSIGRAKPKSLCGTFGSRFWIEAWDYPAIGVYFADCPSAGHDMFCLDYRECGETGEPRVVHVDQERGFVITAVAPTFESFVRGLRDEAAFGK